jgi:hypothetical protein
MTCPYERSSWTGLPAPGSSKLSGASASSNLVGQEWFQRLLVEVGPDAGAGQLLNQLGSEIPQFEVAVAGGLAEYLHRFSLCALVLPHNGTAGKIDGGTALHGCLEVFRPVPHIVQADRQLERVVGRCGEAQAFSRTFGVKTPGFDAKKFSAALPSLLISSGTPKELNTSALADFRVSSGHR